MHAGGLVPEGPLELERPGASELGADRGEELVLSSAGAPDLEPLRGGGAGDRGGALGRDPGVAADIDQDVGTQLRLALPPGFLEPGDRADVALVDAGREVVPGLIVRRDPRLSASA